MIKIDNQLKPGDFSKKLSLMWELSGEKIRLIRKEFEEGKGSPVITAAGKYTTRGWTEWTQGFQYGSEILQFDATDDYHFLETGRKAVAGKMTPHISHKGVHDHGFNNLSTYGNLLRLMNEGRIPFNEWERNFYGLAIKISGAVQAGRWTKIPEGGFVYSFNGPHSLFVDTIRSCRILMLSHKLGHFFQGENDKKISLLERAVLHIKATAKYAVFYGEGRDRYDTAVSGWGRTAHESIFNINDGKYRCPNSQQGYSGFTTWTRGLAWAMLGFAEELEFLATLADEELEFLGGKRNLTDEFLRAATATCDFYIRNTPACGVPYWDTGAPELYKIKDYLNRSADPYNPYEPVDSSAAAIGAQGLLRLGRFLINSNNPEMGEKYWQAGLTVLNTLLDYPYLGTSPTHQGLLIHTIYHHPNGWDYVPDGSAIPNGESSMWGDYHLREVALYLQRIINNEPYYTFF